MISVRDGVSADRDRLVRRVSTADALLIGRIRVRRRSRLRLVDARQSAGERFVLVDGRFRRRPSLRRRLFNVVLVVVADAEGAEARYRRRRRRRGLTAIADRDLLTTVDVPRLLVRCWASNGTYNNIPYLFVYYGQMWFNRTL